MSKKTNEKIYYVKGMHCSTCEVLIKQDIKNIDNVDDVKVSLEKSQVVVRTKDNSKAPTLEKLNGIFNELGYSFFENKPKEDNLKQSDLLTLSIGAALLLMAFYFAEKNGVLMNFSITAGSSLGAFFIFGLAAGISSCAALVGGLLLSLSKRWNEMYNNNSKKSWTPFVYFNFSRLVSFALFGGILGAAGSIFKLSITTTAIMTLAVTVIMLIIGFQMVGIKWFNRFTFNFLGDNKYLDKNYDLQGKFIPFVTGALTFFIPCGFTLIAQTSAIASGSFFQGMTQMLAFSLGTLPILALISFSSVKFYSNLAFSKKFSFFSGVVILFFALYTANSQLNVLGLKSLSDLGTKKNETKIVEIDNIAEQVIQMEARGFEYYPKYIKIKSGVKTKWDIYDSGSVGCARAVFARGLYPKVVQLKPGMNSVEFIAPKPGVYKISCSMGMVDPVTVEVY